MQNLLLREGDRRILLLLILLATIALNSSPLLAQTSAATGSIAGTVTSPSDEPLTGVKVSVIDSAGKVITAMTDSKGEYTVGNLAPGTYSVRGEANGFRFPALDRTV